MRQIHHMEGKVVVTDEILSLRLRRFFHYPSLETVPLPNRLKRFVYQVSMAYWSKQIDVYVVYYPKTGSLWYRTMLNRLFGAHYGLSEAEFMRIVTRSMRRHNRPARLAEFPFIHMTHHMPCFNSESWDDMSIDWSPFRGKKVILLTREPKDVLVSLYFHTIYHEFIYGSVPLFQGSMKDMVYNKVYGIEKYLCFYKEWYFHRETPSDLLLIRYEDHRSNPAEIVRKSAQFVGIENITDSTVEDVVSFSSFESMQKRREGAKKFRKPPNKEARHIRKGKVGGYSEYLDEDTIRYIDAVVAEKLPEFYGYMNCV